jgi:hypothetical protein
MYAGHDCWAVPQAHAARGESVADVFWRHGILLGKADIDKVNGGRAVNRAMKVRNGQSAVYLVKTPGNLRLFDQLGEIMPDEHDIRKPGKVDADANGVGGDDGADAFRYGIATRMPRASSPLRARAQPGPAPAADVRASAPRRLGRPRRRLRFATPSRILEDTIWVDRW